MENIDLLIVETPNEYQNGKIYVIRSNLTDKIYVGSTKQKLTTRFKNHCSISNTTCSKQLIVLGDATISLLEDYPCTSRRELELRERYFQKLHSANLINFKMAGGKKDEQVSRIESNAKWYAKNKEYHKKRYIEKKAKLIICKTSN